MAKKVTGYIKLQIPAGKATPAPPVGPALGQHGVNIVQFTKAVSYTHLDVYKRQAVSAAHAREVSPPRYWLDTVSSATMSKSSLMP